VLKHLDQFFGPFNIETLAQVIHFAASNSVTDIGGINRYVTPDRIRERLTFPMMSIHGEDNGLVDVATLALMRNLLGKAGIPHLNSDSGVVPRGKDDPVAKAQKPRTIKKLIDRNKQHLARGQPSYLTWRIKGHGHQDCLIGEDARSICRVIAKYLGASDETARTSQDSLIGRCARSIWRVMAKYLGRRDEPTIGPPAPSYKAVAPEFGVRVIREDGKVLIQACDSPGRGPARKALLIPVERDGDQLRMRDDQPTNSADAGIHTIEILEHERIASPYLLPIDDGWLRATKEVLVLLVYDQAEGIGGDARAPETIQDDAHRGQSPAVRAGLEALSRDTLDELRGGLISSALGDRHPERVDELRGEAISGALGHGQPERVTFALAACQYPSDILNHMPDGEHARPGPADMSLLALGDRLAKDDPPTVLLLAGDQIYADATAGLFDPKILYERYRIPYERRGQSRGSKAVMQRLDLDVQMMPDDHEFRDNWAPNDPGEEPGRPDSEIERGTAAYFLYQRPVEKVPDHIWHEKRYNRFRFFLGDARTERDGRTALNWWTAQIMKPKQFERLCDWLRAPDDRPKFVLTASALLPRTLAVTEHPACALQSDAWDGYPLSLHTLLKFVCDHEIKHLVFLSGDAHLSNLVEARVTCKETGKKCTLHSIHTSALYAPYPFANAVPDDFKAEDTFAFSLEEDGKTRHYLCRAETRFFPGDGFAVLTAQRARPGWELDVKFHNERGKIKENGDIRFCLR
jgi:PhoD-like phosphatase